MARQVEIRTKKQVRAIKNELSKITNTTIAKIVVTKDGLELDLTKASSNKLELQTAPTLVARGKVELLIEDFSDNIVSVEFRATGTKKEKEEVLKQANLFRSVAIKFNGAKTDIVSVYKAGRKLYGYNLRSRTNKEVKLEELKKQGYGLYLAGPFSASEGRKNSTTLYKTESSKELVELIDKLSYGAFSQLAGRTMTIGDAQKVASRLSQWKTGMSHTEGCNLTAAFYIGKWGIDDTSHADGKGYLSSRKVAKELSNEKYVVAESAVEGLLIQNRPFSVCKTLSKVTNSSYLRQKVLFDTNHDPDNIIWINREEVTKEIQEEFNKIFLGNKSRFDGKVVVIKSKDAPKDLRSIHYYTDLNGLKSSYDLRLDSGLNILAIDKPLKGGVVNTNMQQLETLLMASPEKTKEIMKSVSADFNKKALHEAMAFKTKVPAVRDFDNLYTAGIVSSVAPKFAAQNQKLLGIAADQAVKRMVKAARGLNYPIPGGSRLVQMDFAADFGARILPPGTCFMPGEKERVVFATRNPKMSAGEFLLMKNLTKKEVNELINKNEALSKEQKKLLKREFRLLSESSIVIPAIEDYKNTTGGMDVDGDTLLVVTYRKFSQLIKKAEREGIINPTAIEVANEGSLQEEKTMKYGLSSIHTSFIRLVNNGNLSIGEITFMNNFLLGALFDLRQGKEEPAREFFKFAGNKQNEKEGKQYVPLLKEETDFNLKKVEVSFEIMEKIVNDIKEMSLTKKNMENALNDLVSIFMMLQMETIDAPKTGRVVPVPFAGLLNKFQQNSKSFLDIDLNISASKKPLGKYQQVDGVLYSVHKDEGWKEVGISPTGAPVKKYFHNDPLHALRLDAARDAMRIARQLRKKYENTSFDEETIQLFIAASHAADKKLVRDLIELKKIYNSINAAVDQEENEQYYEEFVKALANTARVLTNNMEDAERGLLAEAICIPSNNSSKHSSFAMNVLKEEYIKMTLEYFAEIDFAGEVIRYHKNIKGGEILEFKNGVAQTEDKFAATKENINGLFVVKEFNNKLYATKQIKDLIPEVDTTNEIIFRASGSDVHKLKDELINAQETRFEIVYGKGNLIIADGKVVGKFITTPGMGPLNKLYNGLTGVVKGLMVTEEKTNTGSVVPVLVGVLESKSTPFGIN